MKEGAREGQVETEKKEVKEKEGRVKRKRRKKQQSSI